MLSGCCHRDRWRGDAHPLHAGGFSGGDAGFGILKDKAFGGRNAEALRRDEEGFWVGFAVGVVFGTDEDVEAVEQIEHRERFDDGGTGRAGDDGERDATVSLKHMREDGGDWGDVDGGGDVEGLFAFGDLVRVHVGAECFVQDFDGSGERDPAEGVEEVLGEGAALLGYGFGPAFEVQGHGVGDGAVEVEEIGAEVSGWQDEGFGRHLDSVYAVEIENPCLKGETWAPRHTPRLERDCASGPFTVAPVEMTLPPWTRGQERVGTLLS